MIKNKVTKLTLALFVAFTTVSFTTENDKKTVKTDQSTVVWEGRKVGGSHAGTVKLKEGTLEFKNDKLVGGSFVVDMTTIVCTDKEGGLPRLEGHLKSDDFFGVENHPTAKLTFTKVKKSKEGYAVTGNLTIKGKTNPINFTLNVNGNTASTNLKVDRSKYDIKYKSKSFFSDLGDKFIYDDFDLKVNLTF